MSTPLWQHPDVVRLAGRVGRRYSGGDPDVSDDLRQDILVEAWRIAGGYDPALGTESAYVRPYAHAAARTAMSEQHLRSCVRVPEQAARRFRQVVEGGADPEGVISGYTLTAVAMALRTPTGDAPDGDTSGYSEEGDAHLEHALGASGYSHASAEHDAIGRLTLETLFEAADVTEAERTVLDLYYFGDLGDEAIAARLGISRRGVSKRRTRALAKLEAAGRSVGITEGRTGEPVRHRTGNPARPRGMASL